jgi:hypothetical protein
MRRLGFIEGQNLTVDYRAYAQHIDKLSEWAAELSKARVDVSGIWPFAPPRRRQKPFLSLRSQTIWSDRTGELNGPAKRQHNGGQHPCDRARRHRDANGAEIAAAIDMAQASGAAAPERSGVTDALR